MSAVIVAPHCDDAELGCSMMAPGAKLLVISAADVRRWHEQKRGAAILGVSLVGGAEFPDGEITHNKQLVGAIEQAITSAVQTVLTPPYLDTHQDHIAVAAAAISAVRRSPVALIEYETPSVRPDWQPNLWVPMSQADLERQARAVGEHQSQSDRPYMDPAWAAMRAAYRGQQVGLPLAQAYRVVRAVYQVPR